MLYSMPNSDKCGQMRTNADKLGQTRTNADSVSEKSRTFASHFVGVMSELRQCCTPCGSREPIKPLVCAVCVNPVDSG